VNYLAIFVYTTILSFSSEKQVLGSIQIKQHNVVYTTSYMEYGYVWGVGGMNTIDTLLYRRIDLVLSELPLITLI